MSASDSAIAALLWSEELDRFEPSSLLRQRISDDWDDFREQAEALGFDAVEHRAVAINLSEGDEWDYAAHDFILTRNGHGTGFWDGNWHEPWGSKLTELAKSFGEVNCYVDEDDDLVFIDW